MRTHKLMLFSNADSPSGPAVNTCWTENFVNAFFILFMFFNPPRESPAPPAGRPDVPPEEARRSERQAVDLFVSLAVDVLPPAHGPVRGRGGSGGQMETIC